MPPPGVERTPPPPDSPNDSAKGSSLSLFPILAAVVLLTLLGGAWYFGMGPGAADPDRGMPTQPADIFANNEEGEGENAGTPSTPDVDPLKADLEILSTRLNAMEANLKAMTESQSGAVQEKLEALQDLPETVASANETLTALDERIGTLEESLAAVREESAQLQAKIQHLGQGATVPEPEAGPASEPAPTVEESGPALAGADLERVATLFVDRQYAEVQPILRELQESAPDDARVWYYAALVNGFLTGNWEGQTIELVRQGVERERAGNPETSVIDSTFSDLRPQTQSWLTYYRRQAQ